MTLSPLSLVTWDTVLLNSGGSGDRGGVVSVRVLDSIQFNTSSLSPVRNSFVSNIWTAETAMWWDDWRLSLTSGYPR